MKSPQNLEIAQNLCFDDLNEVLSQTGSEFGAAETHGTVCGLICVGQAVQGLSWLEGILGVSEYGDKMAQLGREHVIAVYTGCSEQLHTMDFQFDLMLPDDEASLTDRSVALGEWCRGFINGLGSAEKRIGSRSADVEDALTHFEQIAEIDYEELATSEEDEKDFTDVCEYVRLAVLMIFAEFTEKAAEGAAEVPAYH